MRHGEREGQGGRETKWGKKKAAETGVVKRIGKGKIKEPQKYRYNRVQYFKLATKK